MPLVSASERNRLITIAQMEVAYAPLAESAPGYDFRRDSDLFAEEAHAPAAQSQMQAAMGRGFQTREAEMTLDECSQNWLAQFQPVVVTLDDVRISLTKAMPNT